ncbi:MAG TPA: hypothetical protein VF980_08425 [Thermoanaerobaculia bacterium]
MDDVPRRPAIRLPLLYAAPMSVAMIAYVADLMVGTGWTGFGHYGVPRFALFTAAWCALEAVLATIYLVRLRFVAAAMALDLFLIVLAAVVIGLGMFHR